VIALRRAVLAEGAGGFVVGPVGWGGGAGDEREGRGDGFVGADDDWAPYIEGGGGGGVAAVLEGEAEGTVGEVGDWCGDRVRRAVGAGDLVREGGWVGGDPAERADWAGADDGGGEGDDVVVGVSGAGSWGAGAWGG
jgi:hypothetical protein